MTAGREALSWMKRQERQETRGRRGNRRGQGTARKQEIKGASR